MLNRKILSIGASLLAVIGLTACSKDYEPEMYYSNQVSLEKRIESLQISDLSSKQFVQNGIEEVELVQAVDGDTARFRLKDNEQVITVRFLGTDTPESTSSIQPWGFAASEYVANILNNADQIVIDAMDLYVPGNPTANRMDSNGSRYLAYVWADGKLVNLQTIEQSYSQSGSIAFSAAEGDRYTMSITEKDSDSSKQMDIEDIMYQAELLVKKDAKRIHGEEQDPNFDYSTEPTALNLRDLLADWEKYYRRATLVSVEVVITRYNGKNFYIEDVIDGTKYATYVYAGLSSVSLQRQYPAGTRVKLVGRMSQYGGVPQLSDIDKDAIEVIEKNATIDSATVIAKTAEKSTFESHKDDYNVELDRNGAKALLNKLVQVTFTCQGTGKPSSSGAYTVYTDLALKGDYVFNIGSNGREYSSMGLNIRVNGTVVPYINTGFWEENASYTVIGILSYYDYDGLNDDGEYQIMISNLIKNPNNSSAWGTSVITPVFDDIIIVK